ncbi:1-acyl-sn-glycerol-3-phosphate acyltransferase [Phenylobacterium aquaticum]|uniref:1-acyl-sn-glycerol-3-phosphate acyltransferase n=1 Tax=Phenylobacterium aquaticum TaxID=1763816 RepID=UPI0026EC4817|nr:1-acyl-sn-glycerol-3-phosphate acyltransferase [Phenylobacterium aquaticum]
MNRSVGRLIPSDPATARPAAPAGLMADAVRGLCLAFLKLSGWKIQGDWPDCPKAVLVAAPHTSNWDGVYMLAAAGFYRIRLRWMGKKSLTTGPFGGVVKWLGCVPIDRSASHDVARAMSRAFAAEDRMILAIPPEGTRGLVREWKSGFYHIARLAQVPIIISVLDYGSRTLRIHAVFQPGGDYEADLKLIQACYVGVQGRHRDRFQTGD